MELDLEDLKAVWLNLRAHVDRLASECQQYRDVFEQAPEAYVVTDAGGIIEEANGPAVDILQRRRAYLRGKPFAVLVALDRRADFRRRLARLASGPAAGERSWSTVFESPGLRTDVSLTARLIGAPGERRGICWRLDATQ